MATRVGINGFGRIGRCVFKLLIEEPGFEVVGVNDLTDAHTLAHLLKYDSVTGMYRKNVSWTSDAIVVDGKKVPVLSVKNPAELPWRKLAAELVVESTGVFREKAQCLMHVQAGAKKVLLTVPPKGEVDAIIVMGVNDHTLKPTDVVVSNASCTTNCLAPMAKVLHETVGIRRGLMTTIHAYTNDQRVLDMPHKDLRRARAAAEAVIPTTTGAARAVGKVLPALAGKLDGMAMRVPVKDGSVVDLVAEVNKEATAEGINQAMKEAAEGPLKGIIEYCEDPIVSVDVIGNPHSCVFDALSTTVMDRNFVKLIAWYDNEWAYSYRCVDLLKKMAA